ncbi:sulfotransferase family 2 domain-containing protein [Parvibaculum sp.]|uniref:sulfotransferase family 2 domain-containing protein n=1 Tax=Parvibaculum sp. TaxID=2024848 RepID=UPI00273193D6|nr:sulfotransferase family 2 domain-containing protein [Parvibaculum sp.]MDP1627803.1 sulfotransferase family 2 domain-containing protein [Parvibaculum sp.]MDP2150801.1 sulfotransferase family 2 domain-containing protein [Parvibaculum sp.]MDP3327654.1 sulfotransferase family 2 domain-containing protein [Parvibaculum sp.]
MEIAPQLQDPRRNISFGFVEDIVAVAAAARRNNPLRRTQPYQWTSAGMMRLLSKTRKFFRRLGYRIARCREDLTAQGKKPRVVFIHTPKTGGNSINTYFKEYVGSKGSGRIVRYDDFTSHAVDKFAACAQSAKFVTGHMPWTAFERCRDGNTFAFTILRDPYDRLRSLYYFIVNLPDKYERAEEINDIQKMSIREFLSSPERRVRFYTDNYIARQFAGSLDVLAETPAERARLAESAIQNLSSLDLVGFNDNLDGAFTEIARTAGLPAPCAGRKLNVTANLAASEEKRAEASLPLNEEMRALAKPLVEADMMVYEYFLKTRKITE